jgi:hypothetical protein
VTKRATTSLENATYTNPSPGTAHCGQISRDQFTLRGVTIPTTPAIRNDFIIRKAPDTKFKDKTEDRMEEQYR